MNYALIFAGGTGTRMSGAAKPKQFLELHSKAIIIHTLEIFERHPEIDGIAVVCIESWLDYLKGLIEKAGLKKLNGLFLGVAQVRNQFLMVLKLYTMTLLRVMMILFSFTMVFVLLLMAMLLQIISNALKRTALQLL